MVPSLFIDNLKAFSTSFTPGHHEDAHEFFISVLDHLNRHRSLDTDTFVVGDVTFVDSVFGCSIHTVYECPCLHSPTYIEPSYAISLGLRPCIVDALRDFMTESIESYTCSFCTRSGSCASRSFFDPTALPAVLTLHLKRFTNDSLKLTTHVQFDETLDLSPFTVDQTTALYTLFAVVVHTGERLSNGHFYTFARAPTSPSPAALPSSWYRFDDAKVLPSTLTTVLSSTAYMLFYVRISPVTPLCPPLASVAHVGADVRAGEGGHPGGTHDRFSQDKPAFDEAQEAQPARSDAIEQQQINAAISASLLEASHRPPASIQDRQGDNLARTEVHNAPKSVEPAAVTALPAGIPVVNNAILEATSQPSGDSEPQDNQQCASCCVCGSSEGPFLHSSLHGGQPLVVCTRAGLPLPPLSSRPPSDCESCISVIRETTPMFNSLVFSISSPPPASDVITLRCAATGSPDVDSLVLVESAESPPTRRVVHKSLPNGLPSVPLMLHGSINPVFMPWPRPDGEASACAVRSFRRRWASKPTPAPLRYSSASELADTFQRLLSLEAEASESAAVDSGLSQVAVQWGPGRDIRPTIYFPNALPKDFKINTRVVVSLQAAKGSRLTTLQSSKASRSGTVTHVAQSPVPMVGVSLDIPEKTAPWEEHTCDSSTRFSISKAWQSVPHDRMLAALSKFAQAPGVIGTKLRALLLGHHLPTVQASTSPPLPNTLNTSQQSALQHSLSSVLTLIQGPPGTGKTATSAEIVRNWVALGYRVLVVAQSNSAVDNLTLAISRLGVSLIRHFSSSGPPPDFPYELTAGYHLDTSPFAGDDDKKAAEQFAWYHKLSKDVEYLTETDQLRYRILLKRALSLALSSVPVVCCTCSSAADPALQGRHFDSCLMDEATQAFEPEAYVPLVSSGIQRLVLVGDPKQLGPVVTNPAAAESGLGTSLFERLLLCGYPFTLLDTQYRMHPSLAKFASQQFYDSRVVSGVEASDRLPTPAFPWPVPTVPCFIADTRCPESHQRTSYVNKGEADVVLHVIHVLLSTGVNAADVCVITLYAAQKAHLRPLVDQAMQVDTVDAYQGRECDYVIISLVRSNDKHSIGHGSDSRRMNVALTRARRGLVIVGDVPTFSECALWQNFFTTFNSCIVSTSSSPSGAFSFARPSSTFLTSVVAASAPVTLQHFCLAWDGRYDTMDATARLQVEDRLVQKLNLNRPAPLSFEKKPIGSVWEFARDLPTGRRQLHNTRLEDLLFAHSQVFRPQVRLTLPELLVCWPPGKYSGLLPATAYVARRFGKSTVYYLVVDTRQPDILTSHVRDLVSLLTTVEARCRTEAFTAPTQSCLSCDEEFDDEFRLASDSALAYVGFSLDDAPAGISPDKWAHAATRVDVQGEFLHGAKITRSLAVRAEGRRGHTYLLAAINSIQCFWRTRIVGYYQSSHVRTYWKLANSLRGRCEAWNLRDITKGCSSCPFCTFHALRLSRRWDILCVPSPTDPSLYEFKITLTGRRVKAACNSARMASAVAATASGGLLHLASFHTSADHSAGYVSLHPRKSFKGTLCMKFWRRTGHAPTDSASAAIRSGFLMYRAVRLMRCGYGTMACYFPVHCAESGTIRRVTHMAHSNDFRAQAAVAREVTDWYKTRYVSTLKASLDPLIVCGYFSPGGHADGVRRAGIHAVGIDLQDNISEARRFFEDVIPNRDPRSPVVTCHGGSDALSQEVRDMAVKAHPRTQEVIGDFDTPPCQFYSTLRALPARTHGTPLRSAPLGPSLALKATISLCQARYEKRVHHSVRSEQGMSYFVETVSGGAVQLTPAVGCDRVRGIDFGLPSHDEHLIYFPAKHPVIIDKPLVDGGRYLQSRTCAGSSRPLPPRHPNGSPITPPCCVGNTMSGYNGSTATHSCSAASRLLGIDPEHKIESRQRVNNVFPPPMSELLAAQLAMWGGCNIRLSLPVISYDQAQIDLELNTWHLRLVQGLMATPRVSPPPSLTVYVVCLTASQPGSITVNQRGDLCHAPAGTLGMFLTQVHQAFALVHPDVDFGILARGDSSYSGSVYATGVARFVPSPDTPDTVAFRTNHLYSRDCLGGVFDSDRPLPVKSIEELFAFDPDFDDGARTSGSTFAVPIDDFIERHSLRANTPSDPDSASSRLQLSMLECAVRAPDERGIDDAEESYSEFRPGVRPVRHPPAVCVASQETVDAVGQDAPRLVCWTGKDISFPSTVTLPTQESLRAKYVAARRARNIPTSHDEDFFNKVPEAKDYTTRPVQVQIDVVVPHTNGMFMCIADTVTTARPFACIRHVQRPKMGEPFTPYSLPHAEACARHIGMDANCSDGSFLFAITSTLQRDVPQVVVYDVSFATGGGHLEVTACLWRVPLDTLPVSALSLLAEDQGLTPASVYAVASGVLQSYLQPSCFVPHMLGVSVSDVTTLVVQPATLPRSTLPRPWIQLWFTLDVFHDVVSLSKTIESRFNTGAYSWVQPGMLLCCRFSSSSPCAWFEVEHVKYFTGYAAPAREYGTRLLPHVPNTSSLTEPELEYYFFKLRRNVDPLQWRPRVSKPASVVCWSLTPYTGCPPTLCSSLVSDSPRFPTFTRDWHRFYAAISDRAPHPTATPLRSPSPLLAPDGAPSDDEFDEATCEALEREFRREEKRRGARLFDTPGLHDLRNRLHLTSSNVDNQAFISAVLRIQCAWRGHFVRSRDREYARWSLRYETFLRKAVLEGPRPRRFDAWRRDCAARAIQCSWLRYLVLAVKTQPAVALESTLRLRLRFFSSMSRSTLRTRHALVQRFNSSLPTLFLVARNSFKRRLASTCANILSDIDAIEAGFHAYLVAETASTGATGVDTLLRTLCSQVASRMRNGVNTQFATVQESPTAAQVPNS